MCRYHHAAPVSPYSPMMHAPSPMMSAYPMQMSPMMNSPEISGVSFTIVCVCILVCMCVWVCMRVCASISRVLSLFISVSFSFSLSQREREREIMKVIMERVVYIRIDRDATTIAMMNSDTEISGAMMFLFGFCFMWRKERKGERV